MPFARGPVLAYTGRGRYSTIGQTEYAGSDDVIVIPSDFPTDLATVPRIFWALIPPHGAYEASAVLHDYLCVRLADDDTDPAPIDARDTDGLFRRVMREAGVGPVTRWVMWAGVRWGALANPARRAGWHRDAPLVLLITALLLTCAGFAIFWADRAVHALLHLLT